MDLHFDHGTDIYVVRPCYNDDAIDLIAIGGENSVQILLVTDTVCSPIATFHIGCRVTALAWSPRSISPTLGDEWVIELTAAAADFGLYLLSKCSKNEESIFSFGGGLSGHHGKINDMAFCGGHGEDSMRYVATISDDRMLMVWDLSPSLDISSSLTSSTEDSDFPPVRPQPTAYVIAFPHPLVAVHSHPSSSREFLVSDCRGSIFLTDWRSDPDEREQDGVRRSHLIELIEPHALAAACMGHSISWTGGAVWKRDNPDIIGAAYGAKFAIWDLSVLQGGRPNLMGISFTEGANRFRWCHTYPEYFAISGQSPLKGAVLHVHSTNYIHAKPNAFVVSPSPHFVRDFDFMASPGIPRLAAAAGRELTIFPIGVDA